MKHAYQFSFQEVGNQFSVSLEHGLTTKQVEEQRAIHGLNALPKPEKESFLSRVYHELTEPLSLILIAAAAISFVLGDNKDAIIIAMIVIVNAAMALAQQAKAENALAALEGMSVEEATVLRDGEVQRVSARDLVPGDICIVSAGDKVPADARLFEAVHLQVTESALTGESRPVEKTVIALKESDIALGDRTNMIYKDSIVNYGRGRAIVVDTGSQTEMGKISVLLSEKEEMKTRLERELERVGRVLTGLAIGAAILIFISMYFFVGLSLEETFLTAVSLAIAVVPEGIPVVITTVLAISVTKLARKNAIVRRMSAVETLGAVTYILTDKTGTLTMNEMHVVHAGVHGEVYDVDQNGQLQKAEAFENDAQEYYRRMLECAVLCNDAEYREDAKHIGDPTETALLVAAKAYGISLADLRSQYKRIEEIPFSSYRKKMTVVVENAQGERFVMTKGAPEAVVNGQFAGHEALLEDVGSLAKNGIRNLAFSMRAIGKASIDDVEALEEGHEVLGFLGMKDPLRPEVKTAVSAARKAGVQTIMITGDHMLIAANIGKELGIIDSDAQVMDGGMLGDADIDDLLHLLKTVRVFSRVSPEQKLRIVEAVQAMGNIVAVTGDGVNDAPAIKSADIGIAMGISGTDVTKEVADVVLRDDNYSTIVRAIEQGRVIFSNFVKFLRYQISCNLSGVFIVFFPSLFSLQPAFLPAHILILNLLSETAPSIALGLEKGEGDIMNRPPRDSHEKLLNRARWMDIFIEAVLLSVAALGTYWFAMQYNPAALATATMTTAFLSRVWHAFNSRSETHSIFSRVVPQNKWLFFSAALTILLYVAMIYTEQGNQWFSTVQMDGMLLAVTIGASFLPVIGMELVKIVRRRKRIA